jgi:hypothetical protein
MDNIDQDERPTDVAPPSRAAIPPPPSRDPADLEAQLPTEETAWVRAPASLIAAIDTLERWYECSEELPGRAESAFAELFRCRRSLRSIVAEAPTPTPTKALHGPLNEESLYRLLFGTAAGAIHFVERQIRPRRLDAEELGALASVLQEEADYIKRKLAVRAAAASQDNERAPALTAQGAFALDLHEVLTALEAFLLAKNERYGDSALNPVRIFSKADPIEQIMVRVDDKISRRWHGNGEEGEDAELDLFGYFAILQVARLRAKRGQRP